LAAKPVKTNPLSHLGRAEPAYDLEWEVLDAAVRSPVVRRLDDLAPEDRLALGLTATPRAREESGAPRDAVSALLKATRAR